MPEPTPGTAPELNSPQGPQTPPQLSQQTSPEPGQLPTPEVTPQPSFEDAQRRAAEYEKRFTDTQQAYTQSQQELARLRQMIVGHGAPPAPPANPVDQYAQHFVAKGYGDKAARDSAELVYGIIQNELAPIRQQTQIAQRSADVDYALQQAQYMAPELFTTQQDVDTARQAAMAHIQAGGAPNPQLMCSVVNDRQFWDRRNNPAPQVAPAAMQPLPRQPFANGFNRIGGGFQPSPQISPQTLSPESQRVADEIKARLQK